VQKKKVLMLGTRGIPSAHGGFETFVQRLALYLVKRGWNVTVYCQKTGEDRIVEKIWRGIHLVYIPVARDSALGSIIFDLKSTFHALKREGSILVFGYNTALFSLLYLLANRVNVMNMDGLEWRRGKWNKLQKAWLYFNERCGAYFSDFLIADHPEIKNYLASYVEPAKITVIPYHTEQVINPQKDLIESYGVTIRDYGLVIARPEPENCILEIVAAFSAKPRGYKLIVLGRYCPEDVVYHKQVMEAASEEVIFSGAIYDKKVVDALRYYSRLYLHGHTVGGTNPSLVEALAAGTPILAQDNHFNRWVAGSNSHYFKDAEDCQQKLELLLDNEVELQAMSNAAINRYKEAFADDGDLAIYEQLIKSMMASEKMVLEQELVK
jgi:glycosyltransferase involved in cell wall biosynthesis